MRYNQTTCLAILATSMALVSCSKESEPKRVSQVGLAKPLETISIDATFSFPEVIDLDSPEDKARTFSLTGDRVPKIYFPELEGENAKEYLGIRSRLWFFTKDNPTASGNNTTVTLYDNGNSQETAHVASPNDQYGISRIRKGGITNYRLQIGLSSNTFNTLPQLSSGKEYYVVAGIAPHKRTGQSSEHSIFFPGSLNFDHNNGWNGKHNSYYTKDLELKAVRDGSSVAEAFAPDNVADLNDPSKAADERYAFKLPFMSLYRKLNIDRAKSTASVDLECRMQGVLLCLRPKNLTGRDIIIKKVRFKSNQLAPVGFYELWPGTNRNYYTKTSHTFTRDNKGGRREERRSMVYEYQVKSRGEGTTSYTDHLALSSGETASSRFYLWGAIDNMSDNWATIAHRTRVQVVFAYADAPDEERYSVVVKINPPTTKFEEHKAYNITFPIEVPEMSLTAKIEDIVRVEGAHAWE